MMIPDRHLVLHGLAIKKHGDAGEVAEIIDRPVDIVARVLDDAAAQGRVVGNAGRYLLAPVAQIALAGEYSRYYSGLRGDAGFILGYEQFERVNTDLKALITDWQTMELAGGRVNNDHSNADYDAAIIDRLGALHERAEIVLSRLTSGLARLAVWPRRLVAALEKAEDGAVEWVSDARTPSYHTVWFEMHEDLLRILGRTRSE